MESVEANSMPESVLESAERIGLDSNKRIGVRSSSGRWARSALWSVSQASMISRALLQT
jgi:hypothetical protein